MKKNRMLYAAIAVGAVMLTGSAFAQNTPADSMPSMNMSQHLSVGDQIFLMDLMHANAREIELSRIAYHNAGQHGLSNFAHDMIRAHEDLQRQLLSTYGDMAFTKNWPGSLGKQYENMGNSYGDRDMDNGSMKNGHDWNNWNFLYQSDWNDVYQLRNLSGYGLDVQYIQDMVTDHKKLLDEINMRKDLTHDSAIQSLISSAEPTVQDHLERARGLSFAYSDPFGNQRYNTLLH